ncbi:MAG: hypothetical protein IPJ18_21095 [Betaproteobacteria bacterium]|nr:hypothetical protein [Betaproteobacteria bacterium]
MAVLAGTVGMRSAALAQANHGTVFRIVPHSNLAILDPIWTTADMSRNHGYMIYDTFVWDRRKESDQAPNGRELDRER